MKPSALTVFVVSATLCAAIVLSYAATFALSPPRAYTLCCTSVATQTSAGVAATSSAASLFTAVQTASFAESTTTPAAVSAFFVAHSASQLISAESVNSGLAAKGNIDLVLLENASSIKTTSCQVSITLFQKGAMGASACIANTTRQIAPQFVQYDGQYYYFSVGPLVLPNVNRGLQVIAQIEFGNENATAVYDLVA